jgi:hypothetical protein
MKERHVQTLKSHGRLPSKNVQVMTDITGQYHRVVIASSFESLTAYEEGMKTMGQTAEEKEVMDSLKT